MICELGQYDAAPTVIPEEKVGALENEHTQRSVSFGQVFCCWETFTRWTGWDLNHTASQQVLRLFHKVRVPSTPFGKMAKYQFETLDFILLSRTHVHG